MARFSIIIVAFVAMQSISSNLFSGCELINQSQDIQFIKRYSETMKYLDSNKSRILEVIRNQDGGFLKNDSLQFISIPYFFIKDSCFVSKNCKYNDPLFINCFEWDSQIYSFIINNGKKIYFLETDKNFKSSMTRSEMENYIKLYHLHFDSTYIDMHIFKMGDEIFLYDLGKLKIIGSERNQYFADEYDFYDTLKNEKITVRSSDINGKKKRDHSFYVNAKKVHSKYLEEIRGCCPCVDSMLNLH